MKLFPGPCSSPPQQGTFPDFTSDQVAGCWSCCNVPIIPRVLAETRPWFWGPSCSRASPSSLPRSTALSFRALGLQPTLGSPRTGQGCLGPGQPLFLVLARSPHSFLLLLPSLACGQTHRLWGKSPYSRIRPWWGCVLRTACSSRDCWDSASEQPTLETGI